MTPLGDQLRAARERRGATLVEVSEVTRIRASYLEALERRDWEALPADVFTRGYVRAYAQFLGLNEEHLLKAYGRERRLAGVDGHGDARAYLERMAKTQGVEVRRSGTRSKWMALGLGGGAVGALVVWTFFHSLPVPSRATQNPPEVAPPRTAAIAAIAPATPPLPAPPSEPPGTAEPSSASHLQVPEFGVGTAVVHHRLVGRGERFAEGTVVWFWTSVLGGRRGDEIRHVWLHEGRSIAVAELAVRGAQWRTQSRRRLPEGATGDWTVEARDREGRLIASAGFTCVAAE